MRILVTGADGFVGRHLVTSLLDYHYHIFAGLKAFNSTFQFPIETVFFDLTDPVQVSSLIENVKPDAIIHLAALSMVQDSWGKVSETLVTNTIGTINLIEAVNSFCPKSKIILIGSSEEYGLAGLKGLPLKEDDPCDPQNPYAVSKYAMGKAALQIAEATGLALIHVRPFNHFGPGQRRGFVISDFAFQIACMERGMLPPVIKVGDLTSKRDFTDVRDVVAAYISLLECNQNGIYNVCSGQPRAIGDILDMLIELSDLTFTIEINQSRLRPSEVPVFIGNAQKIESITGWKPSRDFEASLFETLEWWRQQDVTYLKNELSLFNREV